MPRFAEHIDLHHAIKEDGYAGLTIIVYTILSVTQTNTIEALTKAPHIFNGYFCTLSSTLIIKSSKTVEQVLTPPSPQLKNSTMLVSVSSMYILCAL